MSVNPDLRIVIAMPSVFRAEDANDPRFFLFATLTNGLLRFEVVAQLSSGERGSVSGKDFFAALMAHFGARVRIIEGYWSRTSGLTANIDRLNQATAAGIWIQDAAALTWTGLRASEYGFDTVAVIEATPPGTPGHYETVRVEFSQ